MPRFPVAGFRPVPNDLFEVLFTLPEAEQADAMGVSVDLLHLWKDGLAPIPLIAYKMARLIAGELPRSFKPFDRAQVRDGRLVLAGQDWRDSLSFEEIVDMPYMRQCVNLCRIQADLIERLTLERDFYKRQCRREARFGLILNKLFP